MYHGMVKTIPYIGAEENRYTLHTPLSGSSSVLLIALSVWLVPRQPALPGGEPLRSVSTAVRNGSPSAPWLPPGSSEANLNSSDCQGCTVPRLPLWGSWHGVAVTERVMSCFDHTPGCSARTATRFPVNVGNGLDRSGSIVCKFCKSDGESEQSSPPTILQNVVKCAPSGVQRKHE